MPTCSNASQEHVTTRLDDGTALLKRVSPRSGEILDCSREFLWLSEYVFQEMRRDGHRNRPSLISRRDRSIEASAQLVYATEKVSKARITGVTRRNVTGFRNWALHYPTHISLSSCVPPAAKLSLWHFVSSGLAVF